jgi:hypothetical protein
MSGDICAAGIKITATLANTYNTIQDYKKNDPNLAKTVLDAQSPEAQTALKAIDSDRGGKKISAKEISETVPSDSVCPTPVKQAKQANAAPAKPETGTSSTAPAQPNNKTSQTTTSTAANKPSAADSVSPGGTTKVAGSTYSEAERTKLKEVFTSLGLKVGPKGTGDVMTASDSDICKAVATFTKSNPDKAASFAGIGAGHNYGSELVKAAIANPVKAAAGNASTTAASASQTSTMSTPSNGAARTSDVKEIATAMPTKAQYDSAVKALPPILAKLGINPKGADGKDKSTATIAQEIYKLAESPQAETLEKKLSADDIKVLENFSVYEAMSTGQANANTAAKQSGK